MEANTHNRTLALAALFQCVDGVIQIARKGRVDSDLFSSCLNSLLLEQADHLEDLYGGVRELRPGLQVLLSQLGNSNKEAGRDLDITRYAINLLYLERKLSQNSDMFQSLLAGISETQQQLAFFELQHPNIAARLAKLYSDTISKLGPRIIIKGEQSYLSSPENAAKIRVMLLAGIRAALLWRQAGGNRWKLLFTRQNLYKEATALLHEKEIA